MSRRELPLRYTAALGIKLGLLGNVSRGFGKYAEFSSIREEHSPLRDFLGISCSCLRNMARAFWEILVWKRLAVVNTWQTLWQTMLSGWDMVLLIGKSESGIWEKREQEQILCV